MLFGATLEINSNPTQLVNLRIKQGIKPVVKKKLRMEGTLPAKYYHNKVIVKSLSIA
jgi:hypothetical protein